jgi:hypothetical protein
MGGSILGGGGQTSTTNQQQSKGPWPPTIKGLDAFLQALEALVFPGSTSLGTNAQPLAANPVPNQTVAPMSSMQLQGLQATENASAFDQPLLQMAGNFLAQSLGGGPAIGGNTAGGAAAKASLPNLSQLFGPPQQLFGNLTSQGGSGTSGQ